MKKIMYLLVLMVALCGCSTSQQGGQEAKDEAPANQGYLYESGDLKVASDATIEGESDFVTNNKENLSASDLAVGAIIDSMYKDNYSVRFNKDSIEYTLKANGEESNKLASMVTNLATGDDQMKADWEAYKEGLMEATKVYENFEGATAPAILVINPYNAHNVILAIKDGQVVYQFNDSLVGDVLKEGIDEEEIQI